MKVPISWLKEYVDIKIPLKDLMWRMTEVGMTTEGYENIDGEVVLDVEVTPNRPDWLCIIGIARDIAAMTNKKINLPVLPDIPQKKADLPIIVRVEKTGSGRYTGITIANVAIKPSPSWIQKRLKLMGLRPINNLIDITNYVMFELGVPIHVFDYDKLLSKNLVMTKASGGEEFESVDGLKYILPQGALIIKDKPNRVIDLCGIKGGGNTGISAATKNIYIHIPIYNPAVIRKTSQALKLASEASYIYERGANAGGTLDTLKRVVDLIIDCAGGMIASEIIDIKDREYGSWKLTLSQTKLDKVLGLKIDTSQVLKILTNLHLSPKLLKGEYVCLIPPYRGDLKIAEDLIEEIARIYGYNNFPKTLPIGKQAQEVMPYANDHSFEFILKDFLAACGYTEIQTLSLVSEKLITDCHLQLDNHIKLVNPVSSEYQFMRTSLVPNLLSAANLNSDVDDIKLFELNKTYFGPVDKPSEPYKLAALSSNLKYVNLKGVLDLLLQKLTIEEIDIKPTTFDKGMWHPTNSGVIEKGKHMLGTIGEIHPKVLQNMGIKHVLLAMELDLATLKNLSNSIFFKPIPKNPPQIEDLTVQIPQGVELGKVIATIKSVDKVIDSVELVDTYNRNYTFRIYYQHPTKTLTDEEIKTIRTFVSSKLKDNFRIKIT